MIRASFVPVLVIPTTEFPMLVKMLGTLVRLGPSYFDRARELIDPVYLHSSEINPEIKQLYNQLI